MLNFDKVNSTLLLDSKVEALKGISHSRAYALSALNIKSVRDLLTHYPRRYVDMTEVASIAEAPIGKNCTIVAKIVGTKFKKPKPDLPIVELCLSDMTSTMIVTFFRSPWLKDKFCEGQTIIVSGKCEFNYGYLRMSNPYFEIASTDFDEHNVSGFIVPVHPASSKISAVQIRNIINSAISSSGNFLDPLPLDLRLKRNLFSRSAALRAIHFPVSVKEIDEAKNRLVYEELLLLHLYLLNKQAKELKGKSPVAHEITGAILSKFKKLLQFKLTEDQSNAVEEILKSLASPHSTKRMILGDVGTGKTIVAAHALAVAADSGSTALFMVPTEVLARQHFESLSPMLIQAGATCAILTGSTSAEERKSIKDQLKSGKLSVLIGTHSLIEDDIVAPNVSLVIIDEQHRFGVAQREALCRKGEAPDVIYLTATPIPRTLALAIYGNLELSYIRQKPFTTAKRKTTVLPKTLKGKAYDASLAALKRGEQVLIVCPLIGIDSKERKNRADTKIGSSEEETDQKYHPSVVIDNDSDYNSENVSSAISEAKFISERVFVDWKVCLLHGQMSSDEKEQVLNSFRTGECSVLVTTTVIEVGIDFPRATVMIVEDADRFGLAQLHQIRGRVGRSDIDSEVFLISASTVPEAIGRLQMLEKCEDGFELSQYDLSVRREGDLIGIRQSGASILKLVDINRDASIIKYAHEDAVNIIESDPFLLDSKHRALAHEINVLFSEDN